MHRIETEMIQNGKPPQKPANPFEIEYASPRMKVDMSSVAKSATIILIGREIISILLYQLSSISSVFNIQWAVRSKRSSCSAAPINCTPMGKSLFPISNGKLRQGKPAVVQTVEQIGSPVPPMLTNGASPRALGASTAS